MLIRPVMDMANLKALSDADLVCRLEKVVARTNELTVQLLLLLNELEERRLHSEDEYPSLVDFCVQRLGMSESAAYRRVTAARLVRKFPQLLSALERGEIHLSLLVSLRRHLTKENCDDLLAATRGRSRDEVDEILARRAPLPDEPARLRKIPEARTSNEVAPVAKPAFQPGPESRYRFSVTISQERRDQIERLLDRMMDSNPRRDLAVLFERAIDALEGERQRLDTAPRQDTTSRSPEKKPHGASRPVGRRSVNHDGVRPSFIAKARQRGAAADDALELERVIPRSERGGDDQGDARNRRRVEKPSGNERARPGIRQSTLSAARSRPRSRAA